MAKGVQALGRRNALVTAHNVQPYACAVGSMLKWEASIDEKAVDDGNDADQEDSDVLHQRFGVDCEDESDTDATSD